MALIKCPECKNNISDQAEVCPKCGYEFEKESNVRTHYKNSNKPNYSYIIIIVVLLVGAYFIFGQNKTNNNGGNGGTGTGGGDNPTTTPSTNTGYSVYTSPYLGISFEYPNNYKVATDDDGYIYVGQNTNNNKVVIPYVIIGRYDNFNDQVTFLTSFTNYMKKEYSDLVITIDLLSGTIGNKLVYGLAYNYSSNGHLIVDNRYAVNINNRIYMIGSKEENTNSTEINSVVEHIISTLTEGGN